MAETATLRRGLPYWLTGYRSMLRFELASARAWLPTFMFIQILMGAGMAMVYGFYLGDMPPMAATFIVTGAPVLSIVPLGMALLPSLVGAQKTEGSYDFVWSLPVPRPVAAFASFTLFTLLAVPGVAVTLVIAAWRYHVHLQVSPLVVVAVLFTALMSASVGFSLGHAIANPMITNVITNLVIFVVLMFAPIAFPIENFPGWLAAIHRVLPFWHMANAVRAALSQGLVPHVGQSYLVLGAWLAGAWLVAAWVMGRRR